jgi:CARDB protein
MRRTILICLLALTALAAAAPSALAASVPKVRLAACKTALAQADRYAVFTGRMSSLRRGNRMSMRFDLFRQAGGQKSFIRVDAPGLGVWNRASDGVPSYTFRQRVQNLSAPASYQARVTFRWKGPTGRPTVVVSKLTDVCAQPDLRPDLRISFAGTQVVDATQADYSVLVRNAGGTVAGGLTGFDVSLQVGAVVSPLTTIAALGAGASQLVTFRAPRCETGSTVQAMVDPDGRIDESDEANDTVTRACAARRRG